MPCAVAHSDSKGQHPEQKCRENPVHSNGSSPLMVLTPPTVNSFLCELFPLKKIVRTLFHYLGVIPCQSLTFLVEWTVTDEGETSFELILAYFCYF